MSVSTADLLASIKRGVTVPSSQVRFSDDDLLRFADEETQSVIMPLITSIRQEFFVKLKLVTIVANQEAYKIPYRAFGRTLRNIRLVTLDGKLVKDLSYIMPEDAKRFTAIAPGDPWAFTVQGDYIILLPVPSVSTYNIQMFYELAPSKYVTADRAGVVTAFDLTTGIVTIDAANSNFSNGSVMDIVDGTSGNNNKAEDIKNLSYSGTSVTFTASDLPANIAVGDYVTLSNESPVLQIPVEVTQTLVQAVVCRILEALGDFEGLNAAMNRMEKLSEAAMKIMTPRIESKTPVVISRNGLLNQRPFNFRWRYNL